MKHLPTRYVGERVGNSISRTIVEKVDDSKLMQFHQLSGYAGEQQQQIEHVHPYGFVNVVQPPSGGSGAGGVSGGNRMGAEGFMGFMGGGRSHGVVFVAGDRRFRLYKLQNGEVALHDDLGHQVHLTRNGVVISSPNSKKFAHQVMQSDALPQDGKYGQIKQDGRPVVARAQQDKNLHNVSHTQRIDHNVASSIDAGGASAGANVASQMSNLLSQASALISASVGLPGVNAIGSQIVSLASGVTGAGASVASSISGFAASMASGGSMSGMSSLVSSMTPLVAQLSNIVNPGGTTQATHEHFLDMMQGVMSSAFQGQHTTKWDQSGVTHSSSTAVTSTAPQIPHNGAILGSDTLILTKVMTAASYVTSSDGRLKSNIQAMGPVLDRVMRTRVKTFHKKYVRTTPEDGHSIHEEGEDTFGFIAQELRSVFPELVRGNENEEFLSVDEGKVGIVAIAALQELARKVDDLSARLDELT